MMKKNCGECDALNSIGLMVDGKMFFGDIETLQKLVNKTIQNERAKRYAAAQLEAVEKYKKLLISQGNAVLMSVNYGGVLVPSYSERYVEELRKAAGK